MKNVTKKEIIAKIEKSLFHFQVARPGDKRIEEALNAVKDNFKNLSRGQAWSRAYCAQFDVYANHKNAALIATCVMNMVSGGYYAASDSQSLLALIK